ncbi:MAG: DUF512 domain-containing protein [Oscillospiraceae bacterium]|nr:DUF512 domain-containing protein [Oscillospiraceae bacterium]
MSAIVQSIIPGSAAARTTIVPGDILRKINGETIDDVLDYRFRAYDDELFLELTGSSGKLKLCRLRKPEGEDLGLVFENALMDKERSCANNCIFCFIDQNPEGMRNTIYYKDDDVRLSFLQGNYVTLTNLSHRDVARIIKFRISPINVSIHTLDPELRSFMLGNKRGERGIEILKELAQAGIMLNCQIVCCPGVNDGEMLSKTIRGLMAQGASIHSVSVVPVGLTKHRAGLAELRAVACADARKIIRTVEYFNAMCVKARGTGVFFCADELYIKAGYDLPSDAYYEGYPQLENGVGMMRSFVSEFEEALLALKGHELRAKGQVEPFSVATGVLAEKYLTNILKLASTKCDRISGSVHAIRNDFYGESVTVSGLVTGGDLIAQLKNSKLGSRLLVPKNMLRHGDEIFLDDITVSDVSNVLNIPIRIVQQDGADLLQAFLGN